MVGLYHKRRARLRAQNKTMRYLGNVAYVVGIVVVVLVLIIGIFFTGSRVKTPLASLLSAKSGLTVTIEDAEFSPLYPNVIKLYNVSFGNSLIGEFYLEYELGSLFSDQELRIRDIYINKLQLNPHDLEKVATSQFGYESVHADMVRFHHTPLHTQYLQSDDATIRLNDVRFSHERGLSFHTGVVSTEQAQFFARPIKGLTVEFTSHERGLSLDHFSLNMLGGVISGNGIYDLHGDKSLNYDTASATADAESKFTGADISLEELNLSKIVIQDELPTAPAVSLEAKRVNLSDVIFSRSDPDTKSATATTAANHSGAADTASSSTSPTTAQTTANSVATATNTEVNNSFLLQGINGTLQNLRLDDQHFAGMFSGEVDVLSLPQVQTTFEHNKGKARLSSDGVDFAFQGSLYEGDYSLSGSLNYADKTLTLDDVVLHKNKLAINPPRLSFLEQNLGEYTVNLGTARFSNMEFLSFINAFPVSVASISGQAQNLSLVPVASARADTAAASNPATTTDASSDAALAASSAVASLRQLGAHLQPYKPNHDLHASLATLRENAFPNDAQDDADTEQGNGIPALPQGQSLLQWYLQDSLYSNLLMRHIKGTLTVGSDSLHLELPEVLFQESTLQADALLSRELTVPSTLRLTAKDFESADLNSNLIGHFLTGKFDLDLSLQEQLGTAPAAASETPTDTAAALVSAATSDAAASESSDVASNSAEAVDTAERMATQQLLLSGYIDLKSEAMLIADFGLDLINGGKQRNFTLTGTELLTAIQGSVAGISDLRWHTMFTDGVAQSNGQLGLATANMRFTGSANTLSHEVTGEAELISLARDSRTRVALTGTWDKSVYHLTALSRGVDRPGLYLPQYEASAVAKEQTDAAAVLKGLIKREELIPAQMHPEAQEHAQEELSLIDQALQEQQQQTESESDSAASSTSESDSDSAVTTAPAPEAKSDAPTSTTTNEATEVMSPASEGETTATAPSAESGTPPDSVDATADSTTDSDDAADEGIPITADDYVTTGVADPVPDANDKKSATEAGTGSATETTTTAPAPATESDDSSAPTDATAVTSPAAEDEDEDENASKDAMTTAESVTHTDDSTSTEAATDATDEGIPITADDYVITGFEQPPLVPAPTDGDESTEEKAPSAEESADAEPTATDSDNVTANTLAPSPSGTADTGTPSASAPAPATVSSSTPQITHTEPDTATDTHSTEATTTTTTTTPQEHALADTESLPTAQELEAERLRRLKQADDFELNLLQDAFFDSLRDRGEQDEGEDYHYDEDSDDLLF